MQFGKLDTAFAAANLFSLGRESSTIKAIASDWSTRQTAQSFQRISGEVSKVEVLDELGSDCAGKMFLSFHYSSYPKLFHALGTRSTNRTVLSLIGHQTIEHCRALQTLARSFGIEIRFIESGLRMVSKMKKGLEQGHAGLMLLDIPFSKMRAAPNREHPTYGGSFAGLSTMERLVDIIDERREVATVVRGGDGKIRLMREGVLSFSAAFRRLGDLMAHDPADYERLHQFHRFFSFREPRPALVTFRIKGQRYGVLSRSMRTLKLAPDPKLDLIEETSHGVCNDSALVQSFGKAAGEALDVVLCL